MFTGLVEALGRVNRVEPRGGDYRLWVDMGNVSLETVVLGDSIAISGVCLTVVAIQATLCAFDVSTESMQRTSLSGIKVGDRVNLERALTLSKPLGGHLVLGHVDGQGKVVSMREAARSWCVRIAVSADLFKYMAAKGSVTLDGISLTVNAVAMDASGGGTLEVNVIPHTSEMTTIQDWREGRMVNIEVDVVARYVEALLRGGVKPHVGAGDVGQVSAAEGLTLEALIESGFVPH